MLRIFLVQVQTLMVSSKYYPTAATGDQWGGLCSPVDVLMLAWWWCIITSSLIWFLKLRTCWRGCQKNLLQNCFTALKLTPDYFLRLEAHRKTTMFVCILILILVTKKFFLFLIYHISDIAVVVSVDDWQQLFLDFRGKKSVRWGFLCL